MTKEWRYSKSCTMNDLNYDKANIPPDLEKILSDAPENFVIQSALIRCWEVTQDHKKILCSVSGGADSDVMLDMLIRCGAKDKTDFVFFNTGLEYRATLEHLDELENKYGIKIKRVKPVKSIPQSCKEYGIPFWSKDFSQKIYAAQHHGFQWENKSLDELEGTYRHLKSTLKWWCDYGSYNSYKIASAKYMKEFIMQNPPLFNVSNKCCEYAKKKASHYIEKTGGYDLKCVGVRKAEGGVRATAYKTCFSNGDSIDSFRPVWWLRDADKEEYCKHYHVVHSRCYTEYGLKRTGCVGCPFAKDFEKNLEILQEYEPQLYKAAIHIFGESYEYTRKYLTFREQMRRIAK